MEMSPCSLLCYPGLKVASMFISELDPMSCLFKLLIMAFWNGQKSRRFSSLHPCFSQKWTVNSAGQAWAFLCFCGEALINDSDTQAQQSLSHLLVLDTHTYYTGLVATNIRGVWIVSIHLAIRVGWQKYTVISQPEDERITAVDS